MQKYFICSSRWRNGRLNFTHLYFTTKTKWQIERNFSKGWNQKTNFRFLLASATTHCYHIQKELFALSFSGNHSSFNFSGIVELIRHVVHQQITFCSFEILVITFFLWVSDQKTTFVTLNFRMLSILFIIFFHLELYFYYFKNLKFVYFIANILTFSEHKIQQMTKRNIILEFESNGMHLNFIKVKERKWTLSWSLFELPG